jgi:hypothetical protein
MGTGTRPKPSAAVLTRALRAGRQSPLLQFYLEPAGEMFFADAASGETRASASVAHIRTHGSEWFWNSRSQGLDGADQGGCPRDRSVPWPCKDPIPSRLFLTSSIKIGNAARALEPKRASAVGTSAV